MATIYRCDRCGKETKDRHEIVAIELPRSSRLRHSHGWAEDLHSKEVCEDCCNKVNEWLEPLPKQG